MEKWRNTKKRQEEYLPLFEDDTVFCVFDTETTGLDTENDKVIQFSAIRYRLSEGSFKFVDAVDEYINPGVKLSDTITKITGITDDMLIGKPDESTVGLQLIDYLNASDVWIGYNVNFDIKMMRSLGIRVSRPLDSMPAIDVLELARDFIGRDNCGGSLSLQNLASYLLPGKFQFHNSLEDVKATIGIMTELIPMLKDYKDESGNIKTSLIKGKLWDNPHKKEVRLKLTLADGEEGDIYYNLFDHSFMCKKEKRAMKLFNTLDIEDIERQFIAKYGTPFGRDNMTDIGHAWLDFRKEQKKKEKQKAG